MDGHKGGLYSEVWENITHYTRGKTRQANQPIVVPVEKDFDSYLRETINPKLLSCWQNEYSNLGLTKTAPHEIVGAIEKSFIIKEYNLMDFLDIEGAFDNT